MPFRFDNNNTEKQFYAAMVARVREKVFAAEANKLTLRGQKLEPETYF